MDFDEFARFTARHFQPLSVEEECDLIIALISGGGSGDEAAAPVRVEFPVIYWIQVLACI